MRPLKLICLASLLAASRLVAAQTLEEANRFYEKGQYENARVVLEKLTAGGVAEAEFRLANMYVNAVGIPRNVQRGMALYESAARKAHPAAQFALATELVRGVLIPQDKKRAVAQMRTSAKLKHAGAQIFLCMELSAEDSKFYDATDAHAWCEVSSKKNHKQSSDAARRGKATLEKIQASQGAEAVQAARFRAVQYTKAY